MPNISSRSSKASLFFTGGAPYPVLFWFGSPPPYPPTTGGDVKEVVAPYPLLIGGTPYPVGCY